MTTFVKQCNCNAPAQRRRIIIEPQTMANDIVTAAVVYHPEPTCIMCNAPWMPSHEVDPKTLTDPPPPAM